MRSSGHSVKLKATTTIKRKDDTVNSPDTNSSDQSGASISLMKKIRDIFLPKRDAAPKPTCVGWSSSSVSLNGKEILTQGMFTPPGISGLKLSPGEITTLLSYPKLSDKDRKDLITSMKTLETTNNMKEQNNITNATVINTPTKEHYFYAYRWSEDGIWSTTLLYDTPEKALAALKDSGVVQKKLCCITL